MTVAQTVEPTAPKPIRLWPGVVLVTLQWLARYVVPAIFPSTLIYGMLTGLAAGLAVIVWWVFFSRAPWSERLSILAVIVLALVATPYILDPSINGGAMGMLFYLAVIPGLCLALVLAAAVGRRLAPGPRRAVMVAAILLSCGVWALIRTGGLSGEGDSDFAWRWTPTPEERLLAQGGDEPAPIPPAATAPARPEETHVAEVAAPAAVPDQPKVASTPPAPAAAATPPPPVAAAPAAEEPPATAPAPAAAAAPAEWPGFRGPHRDDVIHGVRIATDWSASPPVELWRRPIGPGWSSFAVQGGRLYTQEQRADEELVSCYDAATGAPIWRHGDNARFWESNGGAGPRGTPTVSDGHVYTFGGTGIVNALDARDGSVVWTHDAAADTGAKTPTWGFSSSPLVLGDLVVVAASGKLIAYDRATGERRWLGPAGHASYSSPHLATIAGVEQILQLNGDGVSGVAAADGSLLWQYTASGYPIVQPALTADGDVLISVDSENGLHRVAVTHEAGVWATAERWVSTGLKPYFNDFVVHQGHAYGVDGTGLACVDLADGKRVWKGGHYGGGQVILLADQDVLLVLSEKGDLALVAATPGAFTELAHFAAAIKGKSWNHQVLVGDLLLVRNGEEMAAFRLPLASP